MLHPAVEISSETSEDSGDVLALTVSGLQVFNNTPDETAFYRLTLEREGVQASMLMIQPTLTSFTFEGPPQPVLLDVASMRSDSPNAETCSCALVLVSCSYSDASGFIFVKQATFLSADNTMACCYVWLAPLMCATGGHLCRPIA